MHLNCNNLYGWTMAQPMSLKNFSMYIENLNAFDVTIMPYDSDIGSFLEVDVEYPISLNNEHNNLPFLPYSECPPNSKFKKLLSTLKSKENYVFHYVNLKQALGNGLVLKKIVGYRS